MSSTAEPVGSIDLALAHAARLLRGKPHLAAEQAAEILKVVPRHPVATLMQGVAWRLMSETVGANTGAARAPAGQTGTDRADTAQARRTYLSQAIHSLENLAAEQPGWPAAHYELGLALSRDGRSGPAINSLRRAVELKPDVPDAWRALGDELTAAGDAAGADVAYAQHIKASTHDARSIWAQPSRGGAPSARYHAVPVPRRG